MPHVVSRQHMNEVHLAAYLGDLDRLENVLRDHPHNVEVVDDVSVAFCFIAVLYGHLFSGWPHSLSV